MPVDKIANPAKKGDVVALRQTHTTVFQPGHRTGEAAREEWTLVWVASAKRDGTVVAVRDIGYDIVRKLAHMSGRPYIETLCRHQAAALALINATQPEDRHWPNAEALKAAILAHHKEAAAADTKD